jgi:hypothetical protein
MMLSGVLAYYTYHDYERNFKGRSTGYLITKNIARLGEWNRVCSNNHFKGKQR